MIAHPPDSRLYLFFSSRNKTFPPDRRLYLFFSGCNNYRAPARQTTVSLFFLVVIIIAHPPDRRLYLFFFPVVIMIAHPPDRRLYLFFLVVIKISRHNKKTANYPPEPKTDTTNSTTRKKVPPAHAKRVYLFLRL